MGKNINYFLEKDPKSKELIYVEYDKIEGYKITPRTKKEDAINVNKIVFVSPSMSEKIIKKKIDIKIKKLMIDLNIIDEDDNDSDETLRLSLMEAERLKLRILKNYSKYLGKTYQSLSLKKLQIIINELRIKLYQIRERKEINKYIPNFLDDIEEEKRGRGTR